MKLLIFLVATLVVGLLAGCAPSDAPNIYEELLQNIPDIPGASNGVYINDYALVHELFEIPIPGPEADDEARLDYLVALALEWRTGLGPGPLISAYNINSIAFFDNWQYLGFDFRDIDQSVLAGSFAATLEVVRGRFNPGATDRALSACSECPQGQRLEHNGIQFYSWGEDGISDISKRFSPPAFDQLGRGGRIAILDDYVFRTVVTEDMRALIDANRGDRRSIADREDFQLLASALTELNIYSAFLSGDVPLLQEIIQERLKIESASLQGTPLLPYVAYAAGVGKDQNGDFMAIVLVHSDSVAADANVDRLFNRIEETELFVTRQAWRTVVTSVDDVEIRSVGKVLIAKLPLETSRTIWRDVVQTGDPLLLHE